MFNTLVVFNTLVDLILGGAFEQEGSEREGGSAAGGTFQYVLGKY